MVEKDPPGGGQFDAMDAGPITDLTAESYAATFDTNVLEGITKSVALEVAKSGIRVNAVAPGPTDTGMLTRFTGTAENKAALATQVPLGRLGRSEEVADGIVFIGSEEARFVTGHVLNVDASHSAN
jgi:enoyl-[acyl-carrier-protein] reductase (NADH)